MDALLVTLLYIVFVLSAIVLIVVILLQEGKGGGFGSALGEHGQQTFGVGASGINKFTGWTATIFLASALGIHLVNSNQSGRSITESGGTAVETLPTGTSAPPATPEGE